MGGYILSTCRDGDPAVSTPLDHGSALTSGLIYPFRTLRKTPMGVEYIPTLMAEDMMSMKLPSRRERLLTNVEQCTPHGHRSTAIDHASRFYLKMHGYNDVIPGKGNIGQLLDRAIEQGSVTPEEIAEILSTEEYPIQLAVELEHGFEHER